MLENTFFWSFPLRLNFTTFVMFSAQELKTELFEVQYLS